MPLCNCSCRCSCTAVALIVSAILGVLAAFLQITGVITVTTAFLWVALGIAVVYLGCRCWLPRSQAVRSGMSAAARP